MCSCWLSPFRGVSCSTICKSVFGRVSVCCIASVWVVPAAPAATTAAVLFVVVACMLCAVGCAGTPAPACAEPRVFCGGCNYLVAGARRWMTFAVLLFVTADPCLLVRAMTLAWLPGWCKPLQFLSPARVCMDSAPRFHLYVFWGVRVISLFSHLLCGVCHAASLHHLVRW